MSAPLAHAIEDVGAATEPVRTCVGCRLRVPAATLLRVVVVDGTLVPDLRRRLPGRGAWLHSRVECLDLAERRRSFGRAFRRPSATFESTEIRALVNSGPSGVAVGRIEDRGRNPQPRPSTPKAGRPS